MEEEKAKSESKKINWSLISFGSVILVLSLWAISWYLIDQNIVANDRGTFGDKFGAINALFSGLAFAGIIISIFMQSWELSMQRGEMKDQTKALKLQAKALKLQRKEMKDQTTAINLQAHALALQREEMATTRSEMQKQGFENTFFKMIEVINSEILNHISYYPSSERYDWASFGINLREELIEKLFNNSSIESLTGIGYNSTEIIDRECLEILNQIKSILSLIQKAPLERNESSFYISVLYGILPNSIKLAIFIKVILGQFDHFFSLMNNEDQLSTFIDKKLIYEDEVMTKLLSFLRTKETEMAL